MIFGLVSEQPLDKFGVDVLEEEQRGAGVHEVVEPDAGQLGAPEQRLVGAADHFGGVERRALMRGEQQVHVVVEPRAGPPLAAPRRGPRYGSPYPRGRSRRDGVRGALVFCHRRLGVLLCLRSTLGRKQGGGRGESLQRSKGRTDEKAVRTIVEAVEDGTFQTAKETERGAA